MKRWMIVAAASLSTVVAVTVLALFLAGVFDGDAEAEKDVTSPEAAGTCLEGTVDCEDALLDPDGGGSDGEGVSVAPVCAPGFPDCVDMVVDSTNGDLGDTQPADPIVPATGQCSGDAFEPCLEQAVNAALANAERELGVDESAMIVESATFQEWSDSCLDAAASGEVCAEMITPGFVVVVIADGAPYEFHTDLNGNARLAL